MTGCTTEGGGRSEGDLITESYTTTYISSISVLHVCYYALIFLLKRLCFTLEHTCGNRVLKFAGLNDVSTYLYLYRWHAFRLCVYFQIDSSQGCGAGAGAAGADTFWSEPEPEPDPSKRFARSRSRQKLGGSGSEKGYNFGKKKNGILTAK